MIRYVVKASVEEVRRDSSSCSSAFAATVLGPLIQVDYGFASGWQLTFKTTQNIVQLQRRKGSLAKFTLDGASEGDASGSLDVSCPLVWPVVWFGNLWLLSLLLTDAWVDG